MTESEMMEWLARRWVKELMSRMTIQKIKEVHQTGEDTEVWQIVWEYPRPWVDGQRGGM
jgi:hypothetical protein